MHASARSCRELNLSQSARLLAQYETIANLTGVMAQAAASGDWDAVLALGQQYCHAVAALRGADNESVALSGAERDTKHALLLRILAHDAATRESASPQLARLGNLLGRLNRQQSLHHAYGTPPAS